MYPHRIRLRGPWEGAPAADNPRRVTVPCRLADFGWADLPVHLTRKFGYPGRIDAGERVWLTLDGVDGWATITLNGQVLGEAHNAPFQADVTALLGQRNKLEIQARAQGLGEAALEVRALAYLSHVKARRAAGRLHVEGSVAGTCGRPLELYVLVDGRHASYRTIEAGQSFTAILEEDGRTVRVELVHVSAVWYVVEMVVD